MRHLHCIIKCVPALLCIGSLVLISCQRQTPAVSPLPPTTSPTAIVPTVTVSPNDDWEEIQIPSPRKCYNLEFSPDGQWMICNAGAYVLRTPITQGEIGPTTDLAEWQSGKDFEFLGFPPNESRFVLKEWDAPTKTSTLWLIDPSDPDQREMLYKSEHSIGLAHWSPNGEHVVLVFESGWAELVKDAKTNEPSVVAIEHHLSPVLRVAWSPDSTKIFYNATMKEASGAVVRENFILDITSLETTLLFTDTVVQVPYWSPDDKWIVFSENKMLFLSPTGEHLDTIELPDSLDIIGDVIWSPKDSTCIVFRVREKGEDKIGVLNTITKEFKMLPVTSVLEIIDWTEDGSAVMVLLSDNVVKKVPISK